MVTADSHESKLNKAIANGKALEIQGFTLTESYQSKIEEAIRHILRNYEKEDLVPIVSSVVMELALWGSLANMRQIYFQEHGIDPAEPMGSGAYEDDFQKSITLDSMQNYREAARRRGLFLKTKLTHSHAGLRVEVLSNATHSEHHEERLRKLLRQAMQYNDVMEYFRDNPGDQDGRQLGLAFSILMLREENLRPELMRIGRKGDQVTNSRLEIPFEAEFKSIREMLMNDEMPLPFREPSALPAINDSLGPLVACPICTQSVSDKVFFQDLPAGMLDETAVRANKPGWKSEDGACASCIAVYGADI